MTLKFCWTEKCSLRILKMHQTHIFFLFIVYHYIPFVTKISFPIFLFADTCKHFVNLDIKLMFKVLCFVWSKPFFGPKLFWHHSHSIGMFSSCPSAHKHKATCTCVHTPLFLHTDPQLPPGQTLPLPHSEKWLKENVKSAVLDTVGSCPWSLYNGSGLWPHTDRYKWPALLN